MQFHNHARAMRRRFLLIFVGTFLAVFGIINMRFVAANVQFWLVPGTIEREDSLREAMKLLPLAADTITKPLGDKARLVIDSIGVDAPIVFSASEDETSIFKSLENGVVNYARTAKPGAGGTSLILGHSSAYPWYRGKYGSVFALLGKLKPGDKFYVQYDDGRLFIYTVSRSIVFSPLEGDAKLGNLARADSSTLILVSCWPVGTSYLRIAVRAEQVQL